MRMDFLDRGFGINRTWVAVGATAVSAGAGIYSATQNKGQPSVQDVFTKGPSFEQGQTATNDWLNQLTQDQNDPSGNFGAISPDWNDIWAQTQRQVQQYYNGTATSPGVNDQIKASFAQRGMSGDPAASYLTAASGANEAEQLNEASQAQNIAKQTFAQQGKQNWLNSIASLQNQTANSKSGGDWSGSIVSPTSNQQVGNVIGTAASGIASNEIQQQSQNNQLAYLSSLINPMTPTSFGKSLITGGGGGTPAY